MVDAMTLESRIKSQAYGLGFQLCGITTLGPAPTASAFDAWLADGYAGEMGYLARGAERRRDTRLPVPGATHAIVVALDYGGKAPAGPVARYARGRDYHDVMLERLAELHGWIDHDVGHAVPGKAYVDTGPILERDLARRAGLGWFGKNTMLIHPRLGSFFFLGALFVDLPLESDTPFAPDHCGTCTRCLDACPTGAFVEARVMDARRCISYLTIELKGPIPEPLRESMGDHLYGCDICQDVCPWNARFATAPRDTALAGRDSLAKPDPVEFLSLDDAAFRARYRDTPLARAKRRGLARNAAVVLGNRGQAGDAVALAKAATHDPDPMVRDHAAWALRKTLA